MAKKRRFSTLNTPKDPGKRENTAETPPAGNVRYFTPKDNQDHAENKNGSGTPSDAPEPKRKKEFKRNILYSLKKNNAPQPASLKIEFESDSVKVELVFFDRPNITLCSSEPDPDPAALAEDIKTLARRSY